MSEHKALKIPLPLTIAALVLMIASIIFTAVRVYKANNRWRWANLYSNIEVDNRVSAVYDDVRAKYAFTFKVTNHGASTARIAPYMLSVEYSGSGVGKQEFKYDYNRISFNSLVSCLFDYYIPAGQTALCTVYVPMPENIDTVFVEYYSHDSMYDDNMYLTFHGTYTKERFIVTVNSTDGNDARHITIEDLLA